MLRALAFATASILAACTFAAAPSFTAGAEPVPQEWLTAQHGACVKSCTDAKKSAGFCESYCSCVDRGFATQLSKADYLAIDTAVKQKQPLSQDLSTRVRGVTDRCIAATPAQ